MVSNVTDVYQIAQYVNPYFLYIVIMFVFVAVVSFAVDYFHNKHIEQLGKQMADTTTLAVNSIQNLMTMEIAGKQASDILEAHKKEQTQQK